MPNAARLSDITSHDGIIIGPGVTTVLIGGMPAATVGAMHICKLKVTPPHPPTPFLFGSATVLIDGKPALRSGDLSGCGAQIITGSPDVMIG